jgi:3',5'-cyclic-AMP phosphodiesterase
MLLVAQITDTHLFTDHQAEMFGCRTNQTFAAVIAAIAALEPQPDVLLLTGDISQDDSVGAYQYARSLIEPLQIPTYWLYGNHDQNVTAVDELNHGCITSTKSFTRSGWRFVLLDSMVSQQPHGELSSQQLQWFEQELAADVATSIDGPTAGLPTLVAVHHHPIACGLDAMDAIGLRNAEAFFQVVDRHPQIKVVLNGHIHQEFATQRHGVDYFGTPSTSIQLKPNQANIAVADQPPGFRLLQLHADGTIATTVKWVSID